MQREDAKPRPGPAPEPAERDDVVVAQSRCPFCHDAVKPDDGAWVACAGCLARHHAPCWQEAGRCGACASATRLTPEASGAPRSHSGRVVALLFVAVVAAVLVGGGLWLASARRADMARTAAAQLEAARQRAAAERAAAAVPLTISTARVDPLVFATLRARSADTPTRIVPGQEAQLAPGPYVLELRREDQGVWSVSTVLVEGPDGRGALNDPEGRDALRGRPWWSVPHELHVASTAARRHISKGDWAGARPHLERAAALDPEYCGGAQRAHPTTDPSVGELLAECQRRLDAERR